MALIRTAVPADVPALVALAVRTFPLACPPGVSETAVAEHVAAHLSSSRFEHWIASATDRVVVAAESDGSLCGYVLLIHGHSDDAEMAAAVGPGACLELSKIYVDESAHGSGVAKALMSETLAAAAELDPSSPVFLGTHSLNARGQAFYRKHGFMTVGTRRYVVGDEVHDDVVMLRPAGSIAADG